MSKKIHKLARMFYDYMPNFYRFINPIFNNENSEQYKLSENQIKILMCVFINKSNTPTEIGNIIGIQKGSLTAMIRSLLNLELIEKVIEPSDDRSYKLIVSKRGLDFIQYKRVRVEKELGDLFKDIGKEDMKKVIEGLEILNHHLDQL